MRGFRDRAHAGSILASELTAMELADPVVLGVPRGGVAVGRAVADVLGAELDVALARKVGHPRNPELAVGAVAEDGSVILDDSLMARTDVSPAEIDPIVSAARQELQRRLDRYRAGGAGAKVQGRAAIVVDDGVATGSTLRAVLQVIRSRHPASLVAAIPCGPPETIAGLRDVADVVVCPLQPRTFRAVGEWYRDFHQMSDDEVVGLLRPS